MNWVYTKHTSKASNKAMHRGVVNWDDDPEQEYFRRREPPSYTASATTMEQIDAHDVLAEYEDEIRDLEVNGALAEGPWGRDPYSNGTIAQSNYRDQEADNDVYGIVDEDVIHGDLVQHGDLDIEAGCDEEGVIPDNLEKRSARNNFTRDMDGVSGWDAPYYESVEDRGLTKNHRFRHASAATVGSNGIRSMQGTDVAIPDTTIVTTKKRGTVSVQSDSSMDMPNIVPEYTKPVIRVPRIMNTLPTPTISDLEILEDGNDNVVRSTVKSTVARVANVSDGLLPISDSKNNTPNIHTKKKIVATSNNLGIPDSIEGISSNPTQTHRHNSRDTSKDAGKVVPLLSGINTTQTHRHNSRDTSKDAGKILPISSGVNTTQIHHHNTKNTNLDSNFDLIPIVDTNNVVSTKKHSTRQPSLSTSATNIENGSQIMDNVPNTHKNQQKTHLAVATTSNTLLEHRLVPLSSTLSGHLHSASSRNKPAIVATALPQHNITESRVSTPPINQRNNKPIPAMNSIPMIPLSEAGSSSQLLHPIMKTTLQPLSSQPIVEGIEGVDWHRCDAPNCIRKHPGPKPATTGGQAIPIPPTESGDNRGQTIGKQPSRQTATTGVQATATLPTENGEDKPKPRLRGRLAPVITRQSTAVVGEEDANGDLPKVPTRRVIEFSGSDDAPVKEDGDSNQNIRRKNGVRHEGRSGAAGEDDDHRPSIAPQSRRGETSRAEHRSNAAGDEDGTSLADARQRREHATSRVGEQSGNYRPDTKTRDNPTANRRDGVNDTRQTKTAHAERTAPTTEKQVGRAVRVFSSG